MISFKQLRRFFVTLGLSLSLFSFNPANSWAVTNQVISPPQPEIAFMNRAKAMAKDVEGKAQEAVGNITGDPKDQIMGKAKQAESKARNTAEDLKDNMKLKGRTKAVTKNIEGKTQFELGKASGDRQAQVAAKAKQVESQARNTLEDIKDQFRDIHN